MIFFRSGSVSSSVACMAFVEGNLSKYYGADGTQYWDATISNGSLYVIQKDTTQSGYYLAIMY